MKKYNKENVIQIWTDAHAYLLMMSNEEMKDRVIQKLDVLGCDEEKLIEYLEDFGELFLSGINGEDYQKIESDYIIDSYVNKIDKIIEYVEIAKNYQSMGELNKSLAEEGLYAENEVELQMDTEEAESSTE